MLPKQWIKPVSSQMNMILVCLLIIGAIGVYNWIIAPHQSYIQAAQRFESTTKNLAKKKQMIRNNLNNQKKELKELEEKLNSDLDMLFEPSEAKEFFNSFEVVSEKAGCIMYSLTFPQADLQPSKNKPDTNSRITSKVAKLTILGAYGNITDFMNKLQENSKYVQIESVKIYSDSNIPDYLRCDMSVTIYIVSGKEIHRHEL